VFFKITGYKQQSKHSIVMIFTMFFWSCKWL